MLTLHFIKDWLPFSSHLLKVCEMLTLHFIKDWLPFSSHLLKQYDLKLVIIKKKRCNSLLYDKNYVETERVDKQY